VGLDTAALAPPARCSNCDALLDGPYCSQCGQQSVDLHRPFRQLLSELIDEALSLDTRLVRTLRPLLFRPGAVTRDYLAGRRVAQVPPLRTYLISALVFFGLFSIFPNRARVEVFTTGESRPTGGGTRLTFELPAHMPVHDAGYQQLVARAKASPEAFVAAVGSAVPRAFFLFLPIFAVLLKLFYRREGYFVDHLVFSLYYHAFVFLVLSALFLVSRTDAWLPGSLRALAAAGLLAWLVAYLPIALRRVYGGSRWKTLFKLAGLGVIYLAIFITVGMPLVTLIGLSTF
jgi:Protein of unknown function (DUF3667)